ncbi:hypothetical protein EW146_g3177 [Bondarzewia mesenterica]|uniref:Uncharacterized protein n=1 Tax=Bondarzewia mesenterica TaxID=1095465 RepID=A0A4V3XFI8_9AGAM|nr:hypothetical protein EW146_g3177 [Bondarzewia mesenterica]
MSDPSYPVFPVFTIIGFIIVLIPLPWHLQAWNSGTCLYIVWTAIACLNQFVNSLVWHGNAIDHAPIWCDISTRLIIGIAVAIPSASLCINRRLYKIASMQSASITRRDKQRAVIIDIAIGMGIPVIQMALQYVVQGHRYNIFEDIGCFPTTYNTPLAYPLVVMWPVVIGLVSAVYCLLTLRAFLKRRAQFSQLISTHSSLTINRYFRLMALASADLLFTVPYSLYGLYLNLTSSPLFPWRGWADTHFQFSRVLLIPSSAWHSNHSFAFGLELSRWIVPVCAIVFFAFFGFAEEACRNYCRLFALCGRHLRLWPGSRTRASRGYPDATSSTSTIVSGSLPIYVPRLLPDHQYFDSSIYHTKFEKTLTLQTTTSVTTVYDRNSK